MPGRAGSLCASRGLAALPGPGAPLLDLLRDRVCAHADATWVRSAAQGPPSLSRRALPLLGNVWGDVCACSQSMSSWVGFAAQGRPTMA